MPELDPFERSLETALRAFADRGVIPVDAVEFTARVAGRPRRISWPWRPAQRLAWLLLLLVGLLAALVGGMLLVGSQPERKLPAVVPPVPLTEYGPRHPAPLAPTGVDMLALESATLGGAAADPTGAVWASIGGALARLDPASGAVRTWTVADDAAFGSISWIVPARGAGVWLVPPAGSGDQALRWFDGERFRDVVPAPPGGTDLGWGGVSLAAAPDGSLWSGASTGLFRWDGTSWSAAPEGRPAAGVSGLAVDRSGAVWVGSCNFDSGSCSGVSRYDGTRWETFTDVATVAMIREAPDGSIWVSGDGDLARYDGHAWTRPGGDLPQRLGGWGRVTWGADGTVWSTTCVFFQEEVLIARYDGSAWVEYTAADGLPRSTNCGQVFATAHGVYVGTGDGLYRLVGERWERAWPVTPSSGPAGDVDHLVPVSRDEAWAAGRAGLWHFADGAWTRLPVPEPWAIWDLLRTFDGTLWATLGTQDRNPDDPGLYTLRGTEWVRVGTGSADLLAVDRNGAVWVAASTSSAPTVGAVRSLGLDGRTWRESAPTPSTDLVYEVPGHLAIGRDGAIWVGGSGRFPDVAPPAGWNLHSGLMRYLDGRWEPLRPRGDGSPFAVLDLIVAPNGDVWVVGADVSATDPTNPGHLGPPWIARFDGTRWAVFGQDGGFPEPGQQQTIAYAWGDTRPQSSVAAGPDGAIWVATTSGLARFDGVTWSTFYRRIGFSAVSVAPDGTVWVSGPFGVTRIAASATSP
jgi:hypothetical protein